MTPLPFRRRVLLFGPLFALAYLPSVFAPFDFLDDGNLVYPTGGLSAGEHVQVWWQKVRANVDHLGPFRPVVWAHWELAANMYGGNPLAWRVGRLLWCGLAGLMLLWLMRELRLHPMGAVVAVAAAMWNRERGEVWTSLTLAEGVAMPYALLALVAARKAAASRRAWAWDPAAVVGLLLALGCKNTFVALIPPMILLRVWGVGGRWKRWAAGLYAAPVLLVLGHLVYVKVNPGPQHYATPGPSWAQAADIASWLFHAAGLEYLGAGVLAVAAVLWWRRKHGTRDAGHGTQDGNGIDSRISCPVSPTLQISLGLLLLLCGFVVYLPVDIMCGRYTMPAVWGADVLLAVLIGRFAALPRSWPKVVGWVLIGGGLLAVLTAGLGRQEKVIARSRMLWPLLEHVERSAPPGAVVEWVSGSGDELNAEEGIHFAWHLEHRGRPDVRVRLVDAAGGLVQRVELPPPPGPARFRVAARPPDDPNWHTAVESTVQYRFSRHTYAGVVQEPSP